MQTSDLNHDCKAGLFTHLPAQTQDALANAQDDRQPAIAKAADAVASRPRTLQQDIVTAVAMRNANARLWEQLEEEKLRYPGGSTWAPDEERLFELLFLRQDLPILPIHWEMDLSGVPLSSSNFADDDSPCVVYAHSKDNLATNALVRLIELTAEIRTASESGLHDQIPGRIKDGLDRFLAWAAEDGGYSHLRVVPNVITEILNTDLQERDITEHMQSRMRALGRLQREFLREDRDPAFWHALSPNNHSLLQPRAGATAAVAADAGFCCDDGATMSDLLCQEYLSPRSNARVKYRRVAQTRKCHRQRSGNHHPIVKDELVDSPPFSAALAPDVSTPRRLRTLAGSSDSNEPDELARPGEPLPSTPRTHCKAAGHVFTPSPAGDDTPRTYRRPLPVVYGLFILNTCVFILTADAARGDRAYVSFHVDVDFTERRQSVWNALTVAMVACQARDELRSRADDFDLLDTGGEDSDPDR